MNCRRFAAALAAGVLLFSVPALANGDGSGRLVKIAGGRKLYIECRGSGSPTVILQSGYRNNADHKRWLEAEDKTGLEHLGARSGDRGRPRTA